MNSITLPLEILNSYFDRIILTLPVSHSNGQILANGQSEKVMKSHFSIRRSKQLIYKSIDNAWTFKSSDGNFICISYFTAKSALCIYAYNGIL